jgi:hypothetical protein
MVLSKAMVNGSANERPELGQLLLWVLPSDSCLAREARFHVFPSRL